MNCYNSCPTTVFQHHIKKDTVHQLVILLVLCVLATPASAELNTEKPTIVLNTTGYEPLSNHEHKGLMDLIAIEAFQRCGYTVKFETLPAERALRHANKGITDGELARIQGMEKLYPNLIRVPEKLIDWYFVAFSKQPIDLQDGWQSLANRNIAYITGWKIYEKNTPPTASRTQVRNAEQLFTLLSRNRTDIALYNRVSGNYLIERMKLDGIKELSPPLAIREMYIYLNKKYSRLVPRVSKALADMKADGTYRHILETGKLATD